MIPRSVTMMTICSAVIRSSTRLWCGRIGSPDPQKGRKRPYRLDSIAHASSRAVAAGPAGKLVSGLRRVTHVLDLTTGPSIGVIRHQSTVATLRQRRFRSEDLLIFCGLLT